jgi:hypothetical protein
VALPLAAPLVLSAVRAVIRYRGRVDQILSLNAVADALPFRLPPAPADSTLYEDAMYAFFETDHGKSVLALRTRTQDFADLLKARDEGARRGTIKRQLDACMALYYQAAEVDPTIALPGDAAPKVVGNGPSQELRLAYFVVESDRLTRNSALTRIILATADTLLEVVGENAGAFISSPRTRTLVESLLQEFAIDHDFDDASAREIFRQLLNATAVAVLDHPEVLPNKPAMTALYGAINDVRTKLKGDLGSDQKAQEEFFQLIDSDGLKQVVNAFLTRVGEDPSLVTGSQHARKAISAVLLEMRGEALSVFSDKGARVRALEALIAVGADRVQGVLAPKEGQGQPFSAALLTAVAKSVGDHARGRGIADKISRGELLGDLYGVVLRAAAAHAGALNVPKFGSDMVAALAGELAKVSPKAIKDEQTWNVLLGAALGVLGKHPAILAKNNVFASQVLAAALGAAAGAVSDGLSIADAEVVLDAALSSAGEHAAISGFGDTAAAVLQIVAKAVADAELKELKQPAARKTLLLGAVAALNANPKVWGDTKARDALQPLVTSLIEVAGEGRRRNLLGEQSVVEVVRRLLLAASRRARVLADNPAVSADLRKLLLIALEAADADLGRHVAHEDVPALLERATQAFLKAPFAIVEAARAGVDQLLNEILAVLEEER